MSTNLIIVVGGVSLGLLTTAILYAYNLGFDRGLKEAARRRRLVQK